MDIDVGVSVGGCLPVCASVCACVCTCGHVCMCMCRIKCMHTYAYTGVCAHPSMQVYVCMCVHVNDCKLSKKKIKHDLPLHLGCTE